MALSTYIISNLGCNIVLKSSRVHIVVIGLIERLIYFIVNGEFKECLC